MRALTFTPRVGLLFLVALLTHRPVAAQAPQSETAQQDGAFRVEPRAYVQFDWRGYPNWPVSPGGGRLEYDTFEIRRARIGLDGRWRRWSFEVTLDPQDTDDDTVVKDAYGQFRFSRAVRVRVGQFKLPGGREYMTSARTVDFMERSALAGSAGSGRDVGGMLTGEIGSQVEYQVGAFAGDGHGRASRAGVTTAGRLVWSPATDLQIGASSSVGRTRADDGEQSNGLDGRSSSGYRFFERLYVHGRRQRFGVDAAWTPPGWTFAAETIHATDERLEQGLDFEDLPSVVARGWSLAVKHRFWRRPGGSSAREIDVGLRFDWLSFDDSAAPTDRDSVRVRATDIRERSAGTLTAGVTWRPTAWSRVLANASWERYGEIRSAPEAGKASPYFTFGTRFQLELP